MTYPIEHRFSESWKKCATQDKVDLVRFAERSLTEVLEVIDQQVAVDQWVENHLLSRGVVNPSPEQIKMAELRVVEMLAASLAFEHPDFSRVMDFVSDNEDTLFPDLSLPKVGSGIYSRIPTPNYLGKPFFHLVEGFSEELQLTESRFDKRPNIYGQDGRLRNIRLYCRYRGPEWEGELDFLVRNGDIALVSALFNADLLDEREIMQTMITCDEQHLLDLRIMMTGSGEMGLQEASWRFREMLRCVFSPIMFTMIPDSNHTAYVSKQMQILKDCEYLKNLAVYDLFSIIGEAGLHTDSARFTPGLIRKTFEYLDVNMPHFYRHASVSLLNMPAGEAFDFRFDRKAFSKKANAAYISMISRLDKDGLVSKEGTLSSDFDIKKALVLLVSEAEFSVDDLSSTDRRWLYQITRFQSLLSGMESIDLTQTLESDLGL